MNSNQKEILLLSELYRRYRSGQSDFDDTIEMVSNSSNDRISYLLNISDDRIRFELIVCMLSELPIERNRRLLNPYTEYVKFIKALQQNHPMEVLEELYFLAKEQIRTKYEPLGPYEILRLI